MYGMKERQRPNTKPHKTKHRPRNPRQVIVCASIYYFVGLCLDVIVCEEGKSPAVPSGSDFFLIFFGWGEGDILPSPFIKVYIKLNMSFCSSFLSNPI